MPGWPGQVYRAYAPPWRERRRDGYGSFGKRRERLWRGHGAWGRLAATSAMTAPPDLLVRGHPIRNQRHGFRRTAGYRTSGTRRARAHGDAMAHWPGHRWVQWLVQARLGLDPVHCRTAEKV